MRENRAAYFKALGLAAPPAKPRISGRAWRLTGATVVDRERDARLAALKRSHDIRQFEIELYWKRATYFWVLQAAVFTALGLILTNTGKPIPQIVPVALAALGLLTSAAGWLSAEGSKFWQENWEHHIDMLEDEFEGKLHKTVWIGRKGVRWSVSKINGQLILSFVAFWLLVFIVVCISAVPAWSFCLAKSWAAADFTQPIIIAAILATVIGLFCLYRQKTELRGSRPKWEIEPQLAEIQRHRSSLLKKIHDAPFIIKKGQGE